MTTVQPHVLQSSGLAFAGKTQLTSRASSPIEATYNRPEEAVDDQVPEAYRYANYGEGKVNILGSPFIGASSDFGIEGFRAGAFMAQSVGSASLTSAAISV